MVIVVENRHGIPTFKSCPRLFAFHRALISLGKIRIQLFSLQQWVNGKATSLGERKFSINNFQTDLVSHPARVEGLGKYILYTDNFMVFVMKSNESGTNNKYGERERECVREREKERGRKSGIYKVGSQKYFRKRLECCYLKKKKLEFKK